MQWSRGIGDHEGILSRKEIRLWQMRDEVLRRRDSLGIGEEEKAIHSGIGVKWPSSLSFDLTFLHGLRELAIFAARHSHVGVDRLILANC